MSIEKMIKAYVDLGYDEIDAQAKVSQDIILLKISNSRFSKNITIKGGVLMHNISDDKRRATRDLDLDFIKYSLDDNSIRNFRKTLNMVNDGMVITIIGEIKELHQQDYNGKRVNIIISDNYANEIKTKLDIGVQREIDIEQDEYYFYFSSIDKHACLLINSPEQIFVEKIKSLLKLGFRSTKYKDLFDLYYLINASKLNKLKLNKYFDILTFKDKNMREKRYNDIYDRLDITFNSIGYKFNLSNPKNNWLDINNEKAIRNVLTYIKTLDSETSIISQ